MATTKLDIRFIAKIENRYDSDYETFSANVAYMGDPTNWNQSGVRNPTDRDDSDEKSALADLRITAQRNRTDVDGEWYGFHLSYRDVYSADLRRAKLMVKQLTAIERKMDKLNERFGYPRDLADFCARCADVLDASCPRPFGRWTDALNIDGTHYRWVGIDGLSTFLARATTGT